MPEKAPLVELRALSRQYEEGGRYRSVLHGLDAVVATGESVALFGRSGSGKSTLLNLIAGIDRPDQGAVLIGGTDISRLDERERTLFRRRNIGFVYQFFNLIPTLTVGENVLLPLQLNRVDDRQGRARVLELLRAVELDERRDAFPDRLSGGEQQRVAIARALAHDPLLILADEPTGNLDSETGQRVIQMLGHLVRDQGKTLIVATHSSEVMPLVDRVLYLDQGRLSPMPTGS